MYYEQEGKKAGLTEGMLIGEKREKRKGEAKQINATISYVKNLMQKKNMILKEAFDLLGVEDKLRHKIE